MSNLTSLPPIQGAVAMSASSTATFRECPRKYELSFLRMLSPESLKAPFFVGTMVHQGLARFYKGEHPRAILESIQDQIYAATRAAFVPEEGMESLDKEASIVCGMLLGYFKHYGPKDRADWPEAKTELGFDFLWNDGKTPNMGTIDLAGVYRPDGQMWVMEHKTTGMSGIEFLQKWHLGFQPHNYVWAGYRLARLGFIPKPPVGCVINVLKKPGIRRKQTETQEQFNERLTNEFLVNPSKYMIREWIPITEGECEDWYVKNQDYFVRQMNACMAAGFFPQNTDSCHSHYGACQFWPICHVGAKDPGIYQYFRLKERQFEEVENVVASDR